MILRGKEARRKSVYVPGAVLFLILFLFSACDPYRRLAKSKSLADRDSAAFGYFRRKQYESASQLMEELVGLYRGNIRGAEVLYHLALARMYLKDYYAAERYFGQLVEEYPLSSRAEEALFMQASMNYRLSADYDFDQRETRRAIDLLQVYLTLYSEHSHAAEAERMLKELERKLELKAFHTAEVFYRIGRYRAATVLYSDFLTYATQPDLREEAAYKRAMAAFRMAEQSITEKQLPRFQEAETFYRTFAQEYPSSSYLPTLQNAYEHTKRVLQVPR
jgi:outer membrane protein assembly factor BamD